MAGLRTDTKLLRDVPLEQQSNSLSQFVDSLPEERGFFEKLKGDNGLDPSNPKDHTLLSNFIQGIQSGQLDEQRIQKLMKRNPSSASMFASAFDQFNRASKQQKGFQDLTQQFISPAKAPVSELNQQTGLIQETSPAEPARNDLQGLTNALISRGSLETAGKISGIEKQQREGANEPFAKVNPKDFTRTSVDRFEKSRRFADLVPTDNLDPEKTNTLASNLRKEFIRLSGTFIDVRDSFGRIQESAKEPSAAGDLALIFNYMKMLDPASVVREGEFATAANTASVPDRIRAQYNKVISGERLAPNTRNDFIKRAGLLFNRQLMTHKKLENQYSGLAKRVNVPSENVVLDFTADTLKNAPQERPTNDLGGGFTFKGSRPK